MPLRSALRSLIFDEGCAVKDVLEVRFLTLNSTSAGPQQPFPTQAEDSNSSGYIEIAVTVSALQRLGIRISDDDILMLLQRFKHPYSATLINYHKLLDALQTEAPKGYIDPARHHSSLPHPYGAVAEMVEGIVDAAWATIQKHERNPNLQQFRSSSRVKMLQAPAFTAASHPARHVSIAEDCVLRLDVGGHVDVSRLRPPSGSPLCNFTAFPLGNRLSVSNEPYHMFGGASGGDALWAAAARLWASSQGAWGQVHYGSVAAASPVAPPPAADHHRSPHLLESVMSICDRVSGGAALGAVGFPPALQSIALLDGLLGREKASRSMKPAMVAPPVVLWPRDPAQRGVLWVGACTLVDAADCVVGTELRWFHISRSALEGDVEHSSFMGVEPASIAQKLQQELAEEDADVGRVEALAAALASCPGGGMWPNTVSSPVRWLAFARIPAAAKEVTLSPDGRFTSLRCEALPVVQAASQPHAALLSDTFSSCLWCIHHHPSVFAPAAPAPQADAAVQQVESAQAALMGSDSDSNSSSDSEDDSQADMDARKRTAPQSAAPFFATRELLGDAPPPAPLQPAQLPLTLCIAPPELQAHRDQIAQQMVHAVQSMIAAQTPSSGSKKSPSATPRDGKGDASQEHAAAPVHLPQLTHCCFLTQCGVLHSGGMDAAVSSAWESSATGLGRGLLAAYGGGEDEDDLEMSGGVSSLGQSTVVSSRSGRSTASRCSASTARSAGSTQSGRALARAGNTGQFKGAEGAALQPPVNTPGGDGSAVTVGLAVSWVGAGSDTSSSIRRFDMPLALLCPQLASTHGTRKHLQDQAQHWANSQLWRADGWLWAWPWRAAVLAHLTAGRLGDLATDPATQPTRESADAAIRAYFSCLAAGQRIPSPLEVGQEPGSAAQGALPLTADCRSQLYVPGGVSALATDSAQAPGVASGLSTGASTVVAVGSVDGTVLALSPLSLSITHALEPFRSKHAVPVAVSALAVSPDARWLAAGSAGGMLHLYDLLCSHASVTDHAHSFVAAALRRQAEAAKIQAAARSSTRNSSLPSYMQATSSRKQQVKQDKATAQRRAATYSGQAVDLPAASSRAFGENLAPKWGLLHGAASAEFAQSSLHKAQNSGADLATSLASSSYMGALVAARRDTLGSLQDLQFVQKALRQPHEPVGLLGPPSSHAGSHFGASVSFSRAPTDKSGKGTAEAPPVAPAGSALPLLLSTSITRSEGGLASTEILLHDVHGGSLLAVGGSAAAGDPPVTTAAGVLFAPRLQPGTLQVTSLEQLITAHVPAAVPEAAHFSMPGDEQSSILRRFCSLTPAQRAGAASVHAGADAVVHNVLMQRPSAGRLLSRSASRKPTRRVHAAVESADSFEATLPGASATANTAGGLLAAPSGTQHDTSARAHVSQYMSARGLVRQQRELRQQTRIHALRSVLKNN